MEKMLHEYQQGMKLLGEKNPEELKKFGEFIGSVLKDGKLDLKTKELIALGIALSLRCAYCIGIHTEKCYQAGATTDEIIETATVAVLMGGGPTLTYFAELKKAIDLFGPKYQPSTK